MKENIWEFIKKISENLIEKSSKYISITPSNILSKLVLIFISLLLIYLASIITKKGVKILLYIVGTIILLLVGINFIQNI